MVHSMTDTTTGMAHQKCACSRNRMCALHRAQMRKLTAKPDEEFKRKRQAEKVAEGIERLRQMHGGIR